MKRMVIERYVPPAPPTAPDGLPPVEPLPAPDGRYSWSFMKRRAWADAWGRDTVIQIAKRYARTCLVAQDMEIAALQAERDALRAEVNELRAMHG